MPQLKNVNWDNENLRGDTLLYNVRTNDGDPDGDHVHLFYYMRYQDTGDPWEKKVQSRFGLYSNGDERAYLQGQFNNNVTGSVSFNGSSHDSEGISGTAETVVRYNSSGKWSSSVTMSFSQTGGSYSGGAGLDIGGTYPYTTTISLPDLPTSTLTITKSPDAGGIVSGAGTYVTEQSVTVTAGANPGYRFVGWYIGTTLKSDNSAYTFTIKENTTLIAKFVERYSVTLSRDPEIGGTVFPVGTNSYDKGQDVSISSTTNSGYAFLGWYNNGTLYNNKPSFLYTAQTTISLLAKWVKTYFLDIRSNNINYGTVSGNSGNIPVGTLATIIATPTYKGIFLGWYDGDALLTLENSYSFTVSNDVTYIARFCSANMVRYKIAD